MVDDSLGLGFLKMSLVLVYHKNCCLGCIVIGGVFFSGGTPYSSYLLVIIPYTLMRTLMGYLEDGRLGLSFKRIDPEYFGRWEIDLVREQKNGRNGKIHRS